ncbi:inositol monophosphatase family protein [Streptomyces sp. NPDC058045]|uniref:inositol monophosphatase family protein n=1 Tax=Streptomyces sp. NPDC058045 TaxID=3346311 RepID=UPI0036ECF0E9
MLPDVAHALRETAAVEIMPRYRHLAEDEISAKSGPHDLVTVADRGAEERLTTALTALLPGSAVVGEESVHTDPARYRALRGTAPVWIVDPIDGTRAFVHGEPGFCTLVALAHHGRVLASWTYAPVTDRMAVAVRGGGAVLDGQPLISGAPPGDRPLRICVSHPEYTRGRQRRALLGVIEAPPGEVETVRCASAGLAYLDVATGALDATAFSWPAAWDHAAGLLLVEEAGGTQLTLDGVPFRIAGDNALPFTAARDSGTAQHILDLLAAGAAGAGD